MTDGKSTGRVRVGTRGSALALWQAEWVKSQIEGRHPGVEVDLVRIKTSGDMILDVPLAQVGGKGLFVKEIEEALLDGRVDLAVHSMKDVPVVFPAGLHLPVITEREDIRDAFVSADGRKLAELPEGAAVGTSSLRRGAQLRNWRPDLRIVSIRGNVQTRLRKVAELNLAGVVLAAAGLKRLGYADRITELIPFELSLPAIGQGALGIETRVGDARIERLVEHLTHRPSSLAVSAERSFLRRLEGGCQVPIAAHGRLEGETLVLEGLVASVDGSRMVRGRISGPTADPEGLGSTLAEDILGRGGRDILSEVYGSPIA